MSPHRRVCVCVCVISVELSNADVIRDLFKQRVMAGFMDRAAKARTPDATIHVAFVLTSDCVAGR